MTKTALRALAAAALMATAGFAHAACDVTVEAGDNMKYNTKEIAVDKSCKEFKVHLKHVGKMNKGSMGHNLVITKTEDMKGVIGDGIKTGAPEYVKPNDERIVAHTKMLGGGEEDTITVDMSKVKTDGDYSFFCPSPGHRSVIPGTLMFSCSLAALPTSPPIKKRPASCRAFLLAQAERLAAGQGGPLVLVHFCLPAFSAPLCWRASSDQDSKNRSKFKPLKMASAPVPLRHHAME